MTNDRFAELFGAAGAQPGPAADAVPHGSRRLDPGGDRGGRAAPDAQPRADRPDRETCASPAASRSIASPTARCCATAISTNIWIQPAAGDAGGAVGAALAAYHLLHGPAAQDATARDGMAGAYLGPHYSQAEIEQRLTAAGAQLRRARRRRADRGDGAGAGRRARRSAGSRAAWSSARARSARARSSAIRARPRCRRCSI